MIEELIYNLVERNLTNMEKKDYSRETAHITMMASIRKYLDTFKVTDAEMNLVKPTEKEMFLYLIYMLQQQKRNDIEILNNLQKIIDFKIDVHNGELDKKELDALIDLYRTQIKLK